MYQFYKQFALLCIIAPVFLLAACKEKEPSPRAYSRVTTQEVTDVTTTGVTFHGEVFYYAPSGIEDHGFVWSTSLPTVASSNKKSLGSKTGKGSFSATVQTGLIAGKVYYVRAYVITKTHTVYGKEVSFTSKGSLAPKITKIEPAIGAFGDTISIYGENFGIITYDHTIKFGETKATIVRATETSLTTVVPDSLSTALSKLQVTYAGQSVTSADEFKLKPPVISSVSPTSGISGMKMSIKGTGFSGFARFNTVKFGNVAATIEAITHRQIDVVIPQGLPEGSSPISVTVAGQTATATTPFKNTLPTISGFSPAAATFGDVLTITGEYFGTSLTDTKVSIGSVDTKILSLTSTQIKVEVPLDLRRSSSVIEVRIKDIATFSPTTFTLLPPVITSFTPTTGEMGATMTIAGRNFHPTIDVYNTYYYGDIFVQIGNNQAVVTSATATELKVTIPSGLTTPENQVKVMINGLSTTASTSFKLLSPVITRISTDTPQAGQFITIEGIHFSPHYYDNSIFFGSIEMNAYESSSTSLTVMVPYNLPSGNYKIAVRVAGQVFTYPKEFVAP